MCNNKDITSRWLNNALNALNTAGFLIDNKDYNFAVNRCYYAALCSIKAVLASDGFESNKSSTNISEFNRRYVKAGALPHKMTEIISSLYDSYYKEENDLFFTATKEDAELKLTDTNFFVDTIDNYINNQSK